MAEQEQPANVPDPAEGLIVPKLGERTMGNWQNARKQILQYWGFDIALNEEPMPLFRGDDNMPLSSHNAQILARMAKTHRGQGRSVVANLLQYCQQRRGQTLIQRAAPGTSREQISSWIRLKDLEQYSTLIIGFQHFELGNFGSPVADTALAAVPLTELTGSTLTLNRPSFEERDAGVQVSSPFDPVTGWHKDPRVAIRIQVSPSPEEVREALLRLLSRFTHRIAEKRGMNAQEASLAALNFSNSAPEMVSSIEALVEQALQTASYSDVQLAHQGNNETTEHGTSTNQPLLEPRQHMGAMPMDTFDEDVPLQARAPHRARPAGESKQQTILKNWGLDTTSMDYPMSMLRPNAEPATTKIMEELATLSCRFPGRAQAVVAAIVEFSAERHSTGRRRRTSEHVSGRDLQQFCSVCGKEDEYAMGNFAAGEPGGDAGQSALQGNDGGNHTEHTSGDQNLSGIFRADDPTSVSTALSVLNRHQNAYSGYRYRPLRPAPPGYHYADSTDSTYQPVEPALANHQPTNPTIATSADDPALANHHSTNPTVATSAEEQSGDAIEPEQTRSQESRKRRRSTEVTDTEMTDDVPEQDTLKSRLRPR